jgi:hypothetical protein
MRLTATYQSPVQRYTNGVWQHDHNDTRTLALALPTEWMSGSNHQFVHEGDSITRLEGGFFGRFVRYTARRIELRGGTNGPHYPSIVATNAAGVECRLEFGDRLVVERHGDPDPANQPRNLLAHIH